MTRNSMRPRREGVVEMSVAKSPCQISFTHGGVGRCGRLISRYLSAFIAVLLINCTRSHMELQRCCLLFSKSLTRGVSLKSIRALCSF